MMDAIRVSKVENVVFQKAGSVSRGTIHLTAHHIIFRYDTGDEEEMWMPYPLISTVNRLPQNLQGQSQINFHTRTFETFSLTFRKDSEATDVFESVKELTVATSVTQLYAFFYTPNPPFPTSDGWSLYSPRDEYGRMGVGSRTKAWRFTDLNKDYTFCPTYPARLVVPTRISDTTLQYAAKYRSKCRIPILSYLHWANYGSITRSSQPMVGITQNRSLQDEKLIEAIFQSHWSPDSRASGSGPVYGATATNLIIDARPTVNAVANTAKGAGTENMEYYKESKKIYLGIDHIHAMRESLAKVVEALREADQLLASINNDLPDQIPGLAVLDRGALRRSGWLRHLSAIVEGTLIITRNIHVNSSHVLVHCSDGWDRTSQLSALAQICLDPYFRTIRGFQVLIEKDWVSFGHKFLDRCGHLSSEKFFSSPIGDSSSGSGADAAQAFLASVQNRFASQHHIKETSPTFHQFLESLRQLQRQFPNRFEYNERFLRKLYYHLYSCQFGTFLYNCDRDRRVGDGSGPPPVERTISVWDYFNSPGEMEKNKNPLYDPSLDDPSRREADSDMGVLFPNPKDIRFWHELYGRTDEEMNGRVVVPALRGPEFVGPVENAEEDPVIQRESTPDIPPDSLSSSAPAGSAALLSAKPPMQRSASPGILSNLASSLPELTPRSSTPRSGSQPPLATSSSQPYGLSSPSTSSPIWNRAKPPEFLSTGGVKSIWGKLSSNATTAFSAVQDAYTGMAKDLRNVSGDEDVAAGERTSELKGKDTLAGWGQDTSPSTPRITTTPLTTGNPWATTSSHSQNSTRAFSLYDENPWGSSFANSAQPATPIRANRSPLEPASPLPADPTIPAPLRRPTGPISGQSTPKPTTSPPTTTNNNTPSADTDPLGVGIL